MISKPIIFIIKTLALVVLKSYIATFNTTNTKKHVIMVEGKLKNLTVELKRYIYIYIYISLKEILFYHVGGSNYYLL